jgi:hypothetical protein
MDRAMFRDITLDKFLYDLFIALLTGIVTGVLTGFYVDRRIRYRERQRLSSASNIMYVEVAEAINQMTEDILPRRFFSSGSKMCEFGDTARANFIVELTDQTIFDVTSPSYRELAEEFAQSLVSLQNKERPAEMKGLEGQDANPQPLSSKPQQMDALAKAKQRLDDVFQRHGFILEPKLRELLAALYQYLFDTLQFGDRARHWEMDQTRKLFAEMLIQDLKLADKIRRYLYPLGKIQTWDDLAKKIDQLFSK